MKAENRDRSLAFIAALAVRAIIGWIFFGSGTALPLAFAYKLLRARPNAFAVVTIAVAVVLWLPEPTAARFDETIRRKTADYAMYRYEGNNLRTAGEPGWVIPACTRPAEQQDWMNGRAVPR